MLQQKIISTGRKLFLSYFSISKNTTMKNFHLIIFLCISICMQAQAADAYNAIYIKTYLETSQKNFDQALKTADSLYTISETPYYQTKSLMLSATLYKQTGNVKKSMEYALKSEQIIGQTDNEVWKAKVYGFLSSEYRILKLYSEAKKYADKTLAACKKIKDPELVNNTSGLMMQEMAYFDIEQKNYKGAIENVKKSQQYFNLTKQDKDFFTANNQQLLGLSYYHLKNFGKALFHYKKASDICRNIPENFLTGLIYNGLASVYIEQNNSQEAKKYLDLAQKISDQSEYLQLKNEVYATSQKYYVMINDLKKFRETEKKKEEVAEKISKKSDSFISDSYSRLDEKKSDAEHTGYIKNIIILAGGILLISGIAYFMVYRRKQKRNIEKFKQILQDSDRIHEFRKEKVTISFAPAIRQISMADPMKAVKADDYGMMTAATEQKLLSKLDEFEKSDLFINNSISMSSLAASCGTNTKYLSYIINTYKNKDFNNYINELRVNYVIEKLRNTPRYRKYKISVLAEEAGFSSQNKFATIFKKTTSISPSLFIKYLEEEMAAEV